MHRASLILAMLLLLPAAAYADSETVRTRLVEEILRRIPEWPKAQVEVPIDIYAEYLRAKMEGPRPPVPPEGPWIDHGEWTVKIDSERPVVSVRMEVVRLPGAAPQSLAVLSSSVVWRDVTLDGKPVELRRDPDGWFHFEAPAAGRFVIAATVDCKPTRTGDLAQISFPVAQATWTTAAVESAAAWDVRFPNSPLPIIGTAAAGTRGTVGLAPSGQLEFSWHPPEAEVQREARIETESTIGWTLADGVHQVRATLDILLWGGQAEELTVNLPPGAERTSITGPDVRDVRTSGTTAQVLLRGPVSQRTRLAISFEVARPAKGAMSLPEFGVAGATNRGGTLAIAGGSGAVILETGSRNLAPMPLHDLPAAARGLLAAAPVYAYELGRGPWQAGIDVVDLAEFPVRETLIDAALYTVLYRPDGSVMTKVVYEVRNRNQQYMKVQLPPKAQLLVAHVNEQQRNLAAAGDGAMLVPLEKSVLTTAGLVSFPVELVYLMPAAPLARSGQLHLALPRTDLPVAYARCALMVPDGMQVRQWSGPLHEVPRWSSETAQREFEYGTGHAAAKPKVEVIKHEGPDVLESLGLVSKWSAGSEAKYDASLLGNREADKEVAAAQELAVQTQQKIIMGRNAYRAGVDFYSRGDYNKAKELFGQVITLTPDSTEAGNASKYLSNVDIALGQSGKGGKGSGDRTTKATTQAILMSQTATNTSMLQQQQGLLDRAKQSERAGNTAEAENLYQVAVNLSGKLQTRGESKQEQDAVIRGAQEYLKNQQDQRGKPSPQTNAPIVLSPAGTSSFGGGIGGAGVVAFEPTIGNYALLNAGATAGAVEEHVLGADDGTVRAPRPQTSQQIEIGQAIAEQQANLGDKLTITSNSSGRSLYTVTSQTNDKRAQDAAVDLNARAVRAQELAQQGRVAEAKELLATLDKEEQGLARRNRSVTVAADRDPDRAAADKAPALGHGVTFSGGIATEVGTRGADQTERAGTVLQLWQQATELRRNYKVDEAVAVVDRILAITPNDARARVWHDDLAYMQAQGQEVTVTDGAAVKALTDTQAAAIQPGEVTHGEEKYLRNPSDKKFKDMTELRRELIKTVQAEAPAVAATRKRLADEIDLDFERTSLDNVLKYIDELKKIDIVISPDVAAQGIDLSSRLVDLKVRRVSVESVFGLILGNDLGYGVGPGYVLIAPKAPTSLQDLPVVSYPVQDMVSDIPAYGNVSPGQTTENGGASLFTVPQDEQASEARQNLEKARKAVAEQAKNLERVQLNVEDIAQGAEDEKKLSEFIGANYGWALSQQPAPKAPVLGNIRVNGNLAARGGTAGGGAHVITPGDTAAGTTVTTIASRRDGGNVTWDGSGYNQTSAGLVGSSGLTKTSAGTLVLSGTNGYSGDTVVSGGVLTLNGGTLTGGGTVIMSGNVTASIAMVDVGGGGMVGLPSVELRTDNWNVPPADGQWDEHRRDVANLATYQGTAGDVLSYHLKNADATSVANTLQSLMGREGDGASVVPDAATNSLIITGGITGMNKVRELVEHLDTQMAAVGEIRVVQLANADAGKVAEAVKRLYDSSGTPRGGQTLVGRPAVSVDERTNSLVVSSSSNDWATIESVIRQLDAAPEAPHDRYREMTWRNSQEADAISLQDDRAYLADAVKAADGNLAVANTTQTVSEVQNLLGRLRTNMGQRVAVGSRNLAIRAADAKSAGIEWTKGPGGAQYAVANEGQLMGLMDIEQRQAAAESGIAQGEVRQDAIVGTQARLANGRTVTISKAGDDRNGLAYDGAEVPVAHDDYLLIDNGLYLTAVKTGRMLHWSAEAQPVQFPGVPAIVMVPVVGRTVKFEKTLLDANDSLELVADYTWQGDGK